VGGWPLRPCLHRKSFVVDQLVLFVERFRGGLSGGTKLGPLGGRRQPRGSRTPLVHGALVVFARGGLAEFGVDLTLLARAAGVGFAGVGVHALVAGIVRGVDLADSLAHADHTVLARGAADGGALLVAVHFGQRVRVQPDGRAILGPTRRIPVAGGIANRLAAGSSARVFGARRRRVISVAAIRAERGDTDGAAQSVHSAFLASGTPDKITRFPVGLEVARLFLLFLLAFVEFHALSLTVAGVSVVANASGHTGGAHLAAVQGARLGAVRFRLVHNVLAGGLAIGRTQIIDLVGLAAFLQIFSGVVDKRQTLFDGDAAAGIITDVSGFAKAFQSGEGASFWTQAKQQEVGTGALDPGFGGDLVFAQTFHGHGSLVDGLLGSQTVLVVGLFVHQISGGRGHHFAGQVASQTATANQIEGTR